MFTFSITSPVPALLLLAYYIAAINIENAFHDSAQADDYLPFGGICLTYTFQTMQNSLQENSKRIKKQLDTKIEIIIGNPPYSVGQKSANDNAQNNYYPKLESRISETYAAGTQATNKNSLNDSYIKAFRWASDRIKENGGIIAFVNNAGGLDGAAQSFFITYSRGIATARDVWCYNFSKSELQKNIQTTINFYNTHTPLNVDSTKISWTRATIQNKNRNREYKFDTNKIFEIMYRPFCKENLYCGEFLIHRRGQFDSFFPTGNEENSLICVPGTY